MYLAIYRNLFAISAVVHDTVLYVMNVAHMQDSRPANHPPKMFEVYSDGENCTPAQQLQQEQLGVALASYGSGGSALLQAHAELYATRQRCKDLEMSLLLKEEALEHRDECLMYSRKQLKESQQECEDLRSQLYHTKRYELPEVRKLQRELSMQDEIRFWRTRYAEVCNKYGEQGVSYRSGAMDAIFDS